MNKNEIIRTNILKTAVELDKVSERIQNAELTDAETLDIFDGLREEIAKLVSDLAKDNRKMAEELK